jgi:hypothetical protein
MKKTEFVIIRSKEIKSLYDVVEVDYDSETVNYVAIEQSFEEAQYIFEQCSSKQEIAV